MSDTSVRLLDRLGYLVVYAPDLPSDHPLTLEQQFSRVFADLEHLRRRARRVDSRHLFELVRCELQESQTHFRTGEREDGRKALLSAEEHLKHALRGKTKSPRFIAGSSGVLKVPE